MRQIGTPRSGPLLPRCLRVSRSCEETDIDAQLDGGQAPRCGVVISSVLPIGSFTGKLQ